MEAEFDSQWGHQLIFNKRGIHHGVRVRIRGEQIELSIGEEKVLYDVGYLVDELTHLMKNIEDKRQTIERRRYEALWQEYRQKGKEE